jgi:hypothetical protein
VIGILHRVTVYVDKICDLPPGTEMCLRSFADREPLLTLHRDDPYVERVRWWRCGSWRSQKQRTIDVKRSQEIPHVTLAQT